VVDALLDSFCKVSLVAVGIIVLLDDTDVLRVLLKFLSAHIFWLVKKFFSLKF
jgi:hypothetical protein